MRRKPGVVVFEDGDSSEERAVQRKSPWFDGLLLLVIWEWG